MLRTECQAGNLSPKSVQGAHSQRLKVKDEIFRARMLPSRRIGPKSFEECYLLQRLVTNFAAFHCPHNFPALRAAKRFAINFEPGSWSEHHDYQPLMTSQARTNFSRTASWKEGIYSIRSGVGKATGRRSSCYGPNCRPAEMDSSVKGIKDVKTGKY